MGTVYQLNLSLLKDVTQIPLFTDIPPGLWAKLAVLPHTRNRLKNAVHFAWLVSSDEVRKVKEDHREAYRQGFLLAALCHYASVPSTTRKDIEHLDPSLEGFKWEHLKHPLPHLLRYMRDVEVHMVPSRIHEATTDGILRWGNEEHALSMTAFVVEGLDAKQFPTVGRKRNGYDRDEIRKAIVWFNDLQSRFGITEAIRLGVEIMAEFLVDKYRLA